MFVMNICIVGILWLGGNRIGRGLMEIGDITALTEYAILILFYVIMAQMVIILLPRAKVCMGRIRDVLNHEPEIPTAHPRCPAKRRRRYAAFSRRIFALPTPTRPPCGGWTSPCAGAKPPPSSAARAAGNPPSPSCCCASMT